MIQEVHGQQLSIRKLKHIEACLLDNVTYQYRSTGFEAIDLPYQALPETDLAAIDTSTIFLNKPLAAPVLIGAMTGGAEKAAKINQNLARAAQRLGIGMMLGSQRVMLANPAALASFQVRDSAPDILLLGNLGVAQLNKGYGAPEIIQAIECVGADALALHANPLQEALQHDGDGDFRAIISTLPELCRDVPYPLVLKEVGHGLSLELAQQVQHVGLAALDVAGAGGTSWAKVELLVHQGEIYPEQLELAEWGIPTAQALLAIHAAMPAMPLIASGGIRTGLQAAKALAMGAQVVALARPLLEPALDSAEAVQGVLEAFIKELRIAMHCTGAKNITALKERGYDARKI